MRNIDYTVLYYLSQLKLGTHPQNSFTTRVLILIVIKLLSFITTALIHIGPNHVLDFPQYLLYQ